jgi:hypothetical protein
MSCYLSREPNAGEDAISNPTLAAKLKTKSQLRSKNGAPTLWWRKKTDARMAAVFPFEREGYITHRNALGLLLQLNPCHAERSA